MPQTDTCRGLKVRFQRATLVRAESYNDLSFYQKQPSWMFTAGAWRYCDRRTGAGGVFAPGIKSGIGFAEMIGSADAARSLLLYGRLDCALLYSPYFRGSSFSPGAGPAAGVKAVLSGRITVHASASYMRYVQGWEPEASAAARWMFVDDIAIDVEYRRTSGTGMIAGSMMLYF